MHVAQNSFVLPPVALPVDSSDAAERAGDGSRVSFCFPLLLLGSTGLAVSPKGSGVRPADAAALPLAPPTAQSIVAKVGGLVLMATERVLARKAARGPRYVIILLLQVLACAHALLRLGRVRAARFGGGGAAARRRRLGCAAGRRAFGGLPLGIRQRPPLKGKPPLQRGREVISLVSLRRVVALDGRHSRPLLSDCSPDIATPIPT